MSGRIGFPMLAALLIASCGGAQDVSSSDFLAAVSDGQTESVQSLLSAGAAVNETGHFLPADFTLAARGFTIGDDTFCPAWKGGARCPEE